MLRVIVFSINEEEGCSPTAMQTAAKAMKSQQKRKPFVQHLPLAEIL